MAKTYRCAVVGATGAVGLKFLECLERRGFPVSELVLYASARSEGKALHFQGKPHRVVGLAKDRVQKFDFAFFSAGSSISKEYAPLFAQQGAVPTFLTPEQYVAFLKAEWAKWGPIVKVTGARAD